MTVSLGEPIAGGQGGRAWDELSVRFDTGMDLAKIRALLQEAKERSGSPGETVSTLNLVAVYFSSAAYDRAKAALEAAGRLHPCRLVVLIAERSAPGESVTARVSVVRAGGMVCLERIVLTAQGAGVRHLGSALVGLLLPELPVVVVWGGRTEGALLGRAVEAADRVIIDSGTRPPEALPAIAELLAKGAPIGDLAWARIFPWMSLAADVLDVPTLREHRGKLKSARVVCAGAIGAEGALLGGWFAARVRNARVELLAGPDAEAGSYVPGEGDGTTAVGWPAPAPLGKGHIAAFEFTAPGVTFALRREKAILAADVRGDDDGEVVHRMRLPPEAPGRLLAVELKLLSGQDELYAAAVQRAAALLTKRKS
ncbi:MAG TPA: glucose-6-phosphate dehydrogenase assembly protein OpcA [Myxococcales bacterium]|nr:glucose-6-phosphate dehydrogenase assembly protein OpcA [Myxococcales bacterium]